MVFKVEVLTAIGRPPTLLDASQVIVRLPDGTAVSMAALYGGGVCVSHFADKTFQETLDKLGIEKKVELEVRNG